MINSLFIYDVFINYLYLIRDKDIMYYHCVLSFCGQYIITERSLTVISQ